MRPENYRPKIYDCFMFFNEIDLLKIRLEELYDYVDYFVIVEARTKHNGEKKLLYFKEHEKDFKKFKDKIIYIPINNPRLNLFDKFYSFLERRIHGTNLFVIGGMLFYFGLWKMDSFQRNQIKKGLVRCDDDDIVLISDLDEILNTEIIPTIIKECYEDKLVRLKQKDYRYFLNGSLNEDWFGTKAVKFGVLKKYFGGNPQRTRYGLAYALTKRLKFFPEIIIIDNGGWHFSYLGGVQKIMEKISSIVHTEHNNPDINNEKNIQKCLDKGVLAWDKSKKIEYVEIDETFPKTIYENKERYKHLIKE